MNLVKFQLALDELINDAIDAGLPLDELSEELASCAVDLADEAAAKIRNEQMGVKP